MNRIVKNLSGKILFGPLKKYYKLKNDASSIAVENVRLREMAANLSHELRTPLAVIIESVALMRDGTAGVLTEQQKRLLYLSHENSLRLNRMINEFLDSTKKERTISAMKRSLFDITSAARTILDSLSLIAGQKGISLDGVIPDKKVEIWGDPDKINEVINNLVDNAIKYNKPEGRISIALHEEDAHVMISVSDTGLGIPKDDIDKVFNRSYRSDRDSKSNVPGSGIGLAVVKDIVKMHQGTVSVESEINMGSKFTVRLPKDLRK